MTSNVYRLMTVGSAIEVAGSSEASQMRSRKTRFRNIGFLTSVGVLFMGIVIDSVVVALFAYVLLGLLLIFEWLQQPR